MLLFPDDTELVARLQKGDVKAFDLVYDKYAGKLYGFGLKYLKSTAEAEELVQSVFLKLWENYKGLNTESSFKSYLFTIAYNEICRLFRKRNYWKKFVTETMHDNNFSSSEAEESITYQSVLERVNQIINILPAKQKSIFLMSRIDGKSSKEIAGEVGLSPGTVDNYISESLKFIRSMLNKENLFVALFISLFIL